jgi:NRAMP (natural resistance-associated macrophage protein)-like metal ion transporter
MPETQIPGTGRPEARGRPLRERLLIAASIIGPGLIAANADNDAGGISTYSIAGARYGYSLLWMLVLITVLLAITQEIGARMGAATGKGLGALIREHFGLRPTAFAMATMLIANVATTVAEFAGIAAGLEIFGVSRYLSVPIAAVAVWFLVARFDFKKVERVFLVLSAFYITYIVSGFLAHPAWNQVATGLVPTFRTDSGYLMTFVATIGTTITPWGQFFIQAYVVDKGIVMKDFKYSRMDVLVGALVTDVVAFFIMVACAATIYSKGLPIQDAKDAALALGPLAGRFAATLFGFGLINASLLGASILPMATSYAVCEAFGWEAGIDRPWRVAPYFYGIFTFSIFAGAATALIPKLPLFLVMLFSQDVNGVLLPVILIFTLLLSADPDVMGEHTNPRWLNVAAWSATFVLIGLTALLVTSSFFPRLLGG